MKSKLALISLASCLTLGIINYHSLKETILSLGHTSVVGKSALIIHANASRKIASVITSANAHGLMEELNKLTVQKLEENKGSSIPQVIAKLESEAKKENLNSNKNEKLNLESKEKEKTEKKIKELEDKIKSLEKIAADAKALDNKKNKEKEEKENSKKKESEEKNKTKIIYRNIEKNPVKNQISNIDDELWGINQIKAMANMQNQLLGFIHEQMQASNLLNQKLMEQNFELQKSILQGNQNSLNNRINPLDIARLFQVGSLLPQNPLNFGQNLNSTSIQDQNRSAQNFVIIPSSPSSQQSIPTQSQGVPAINFSNSPQRTQPAPVVPAPAPSNVPSSVRFI